jgi:cytochrome b561
METPSRYTGTAVWLHWGIAVLVLGGAALGMVTADLPFSPRQLQWISYHKWVGVTVFMLTAARLSWRLWHPVPALPASMPAWQQHIAQATHLLFYVLTLLIPIIGWLQSSASGAQVVYFGVVPLPDLVNKNKELAELLRIVHRNFGYGLLSLIAVHAGAALKHHVTDRDDVLVRMLPFLKAPPKIP